jgi:hypothetical protein
LQEVLLSKLTQFSQENNVLDAESYDIDGFLWRDTCVSSIQLNRTIWKKDSLPPPSKTFVPESTFKN